MRRPVSDGMLRRADSQLHQSSGLDPATTAAQVAAIRHSQQLYQNPFVNMAYTFMDPFPWALSLLSSPLPSSAAKPLSNPPPLPQS